jgi:uncharacterized BrkB/YihY/UPF0761 family membrane protein
VNRERVLRTLTFWLRPDFALRVVNRFQRIVGFDRSMALASTGLTALIPVAVLYSSVVGTVGGQDAANRIIKHYGLSGGGADAVAELFSAAPGTGPSIGVLGVLFLLISLLSFTRAAQRLFEQTWELKPLSVRNTPNGLCWLLSLVAYAAASSWLQIVLSVGRVKLAAAFCEAPLTALFLGWSGWILSARRITVPDLVPFAVVAAVVTSLYTIGANLYLPHLFNSYATRYGAVGAIFALISALFSAMLAIVASAALGREVSDELTRIRGGLRPADDEIRRQWSILVGQVRARWANARARIPHHGEGAATAASEGSAGPGTEGGAAGGQGAGGGGETRSGS